MVKFVGFSSCILFVWALFFLQKNFWFCLIRNIVKYGSGLNEQRMPQTYLLNSYAKIYFKSKQLKKIVTFLLRVKNLTNILFFFPSQECTNVLRAQSRQSVQRLRRHRLRKRLQRTVWCRIGRNHRKQRISDRPRITVRCSLCKVCSLNWLYIKKNRLWKKKRKIWSDILYSSSKKRQCLPTNSAGDTSFYFIFKKFSWNTWWWDGKEIQLLYLWLRVLYYFKIFFSPPSVNYSAFMLW